MYYIGIDLGGTNIAAGLVNKEGKIIDKANLPTLRDRSYYDIIKDMASLCSKLLDENKINLSDLKSIGIGIPGLTDSQDGVVVYCPNINFINVPLRKEFQKYFDTRIYMDNDANCAALAENMYGAAKGSKYSITITLGTGIGGGVIIDDKIYTGFNFAGAELGHNVIISGGEPCGCGRKGCWEAYASATGLIKQTKNALLNNPSSLINTLIEGNPEKINAKTAFDASKQNDESAKAVINQYMEYLAEGLANIINIFQPEIIVIGGGIAKEGEYLLTPLKKLLKDRVYAANLTKNTEIKIAEMENDAGIIGAAMLANN